MRSIPPLGVLAFLFAANLATAIPLPVGIQELSFSFSFTQGGWGEVRGTMTAVVSDNGVPGSNSQTIFPIHTGWRFVDPDRQVQIITHEDSYPAFSILSLDDGVVTGGYLNLIVYDPNIPYRQRPPEGWDLADFHHTLRWNYAGTQSVAGGWMIHGGDPSIHSLVYSHHENVVSTLTLGLRVPDNGDIGLLVAAGLALLGVARRSIRREAGRHGGSCR